MSAKKKSKKQSKKTGEKTAKSAHDEVLDSASRIWLAGLGAMAMAEEEGSKFFRRLVERGEEFQDKGRERLGEVRERAEKQWSDLGETFDKRVVVALERLGVPTHKEVEELNQRLEKLNAKLDQMKKG
jgi:poly(hydroxyalkanoate) granule-associated protein